MPAPKPRLSNVTLPIMRETAVELRRLLGLRSTRHPQLQAVLLSDPAAAIAIFRELQHTRPGTHELVGDAAHAVSLIGLDPFRRLLDSLPAVAQDRRRMPTDPGPAGAYGQAAHAAFYAEAMTRQKGIEGGREIPTAALLQNPAIMALWAAEPESARRASNAVRDGVAVSTAFGAELGRPLEDANRRLARAWALPRLARQAMGDWDDFNPRPLMAKLADGLAQTAAGWQHDDSAAFTALLSEVLDLGEAAAGAWLRAQTVDAARALAHIGYPLPAFELPMLPGDPGQDDEDTPQPAGPGLHAAIGRVMRRIHHEAGATRVVFAMLNPGRSRLRTRLALGVPADGALRRLDVDLTGRNLFSLLLGRPQSVWLHPANAHRYLDYLPASLHGLLDNSGAYLMSLFVDDRPLGLMYGDGGELDERGYQAFRALCAEAVAALTAPAPAAHPGDGRIPRTASC